MNSLKLVFVDYRAEAYIDILRDFSNSGLKKVRLRPLNPFAADVATRALNAGLPTFFVATVDHPEFPLPQNVSLVDVSEGAEATLLFLPEGNALAHSLRDYLDLQEGVVVAPITEYYFKNKPLFVISVPKSGTHLLMELVRAFNYKAGVVCPENPLPGYWYCVEYSNTHTSARDFFNDTVRRAPFGNRLHPFLKSPALFIYRNPLDIVVSEANYYHKDGNTAFAGYLSRLSFDDRLMKLIDDPWLLGTIMDRVENFVAWLEFRNVIPVSFEELVGQRGGGDKEIQRRLIWSLQLKLQIPGNPEQFGEKIFNPESPTFMDGRIGFHRAQFSPEAKRKFLSLPQDVMVALGYDFGETSPTIPISRRAEEFRHRVLEYSHADFADRPVTVEYNHLGFNIVRYRGGYYILPQSLGDFDLSSPEAMGLKRFFITAAPNLEGAKIKLAKSTSLFRILFWKRIAARFWMRARRLILSEGTG